MKLSLAPPLVMLCLSWALSTESAWTAPQSEVSGTSLKARYIQRLAKVPPRKASAYVTLAQWCTANDLSAEATDCYEKALSIDSDCVDARTALGFERYGIDWKKKGAAPRTRRVVLTPEVKKPTSEGGETTGASPPPPPPPGASGASGFRAPIPPASQGSTGTPPPAPPGIVDTSPGGGTSSAGSIVQPFSDAAIAQQIEQKKAWAEASATALGAKFFTYEDKDLLIHTSLSKSSRELKLLRANFLTAKKLLAGMFGSGSSTKIWPYKLQFVLLRSEPEYERFAQLVDSQKASRNPAGGYALGHRVVLWRPESSLVPEVVGRTALEHLGGSDRWVGQWLRDGVAEWIVAQSPQGKKEAIYAEAFVYAGDVLKAEGDAFKVFDLIDRPDYKSKNANRNRALALTLVDYIFKKSKSGFQSLVRTLKSEKAPAPPENEDDFDGFFSLYVAFQEEAIRSASRLRIEDLDRRWKEYVLKTAAKLDEQAKSKAQGEADQNRGRNARGRRGGR